MKQLFIIAMLLVACTTQAQTAAKLIEKYKAFPGAEYKINTEEVRKDFSLNGELYKAEQVQVELDDDQKAQLNADIKALKGYELLTEVNKNDEPKEAGNVIGNMMNQMFTLNIKLKLYGKVQKDIVRDVLIRVDIWGKTVLGHCDCKISKDELLKTYAEKADSMFSDDDLVIDDDDDDGEVVEMKDVLEEVKNGNVLIVINGKEYPDLHSTEDAAKYMEANDIHFNVESWIVGGAVKEKYPNTDKKVVIEFSRSDKETK
jgi:hypothetical protein